MKETDNTNTIQNLEDLAELADYSLMNTLRRDPNATSDGADHSPRQVLADIMSLSILHPLTIHTILPIVRTFLMS